MKTITKIACRTIGALGMGIALYDASRVASYNSKTTAENVKAAQMERAYFNSRTIDKMSYHSNGIRQKVQNFVDFANRWCKSGCFLRYRLLAPCCWVVHTESVCLRR